MAQPRLPTLDQVFEIKETDRRKDYVLNGASLKDIISEKLKELRGVEIEEDEWTSFGEGIAAWAQSNSVRTKWSAVSAIPIAILLAKGYLNDANEFVDCASRNEREFDGITAKLKTPQRNELEDKIIAHRLAAARAKLTGLNMGASREDPGFLHCPPSQKSPSDLGKDNTTAEGAGFIVVNEYDPTPTKKLHALFQPCDEMTNEMKNEIDRVKNILQANSYARGILPMEESRSVQPRYNTFAEKIGFTAQAASVKYSVFGSPSAASSDGNMDGSFSMVSPLSNGEKWALAVWENKGEEASPFSCIRQAGPGYGFGIATFLAGIGMSVDEIFVPVVLYTGIQIQFGAVFVLHPTFPVFTLLSSPFDLSRESGAQEAARYIVRLISHCEETENKVKILLKNMGTPLPKDALSTMGMYLDKKRHFLKEVKQKQPEGPPKGFDLVGNEACAEFGSHHMIRVFNHLDAELDDKIKSSICFPICFREQFGTTPLLLVFEHLCHQDLEGGPFSVGLPPDRALWLKWIESLEAVVSSIHTAGVVHVDLYPSNILWRIGMNGTDIDIKLVDFDVAHIKGGRWVEAVHIILDGIVQERSNLGWVMFDEVNEGWDWQYLSVLRRLAEICTSKATQDTNYMNGIYDGLSSGDVDKINASFRKAANSINIGRSVK